MVPCPHPGRPYREEEEEGRKRRGGGEGRWEEKEKGEGRRRREEKEKGGGRRRREEEEEEEEGEGRKEEEEEGGGRRRRRGRRRRTSVRRPFTPCRPWCRLCVDGLRAGFVYVWAIVPQMWTSAIVPAFSCRFWKPPRTGEVLPNFSSNSDVFLLLQSRSCRRGPGAPRRSRSSSSALRSCPHCFISPLHRLATAPLAFLHRHPRYN